MVCEPAIVGRPTESSFSPAILQAAPKDPANAVEWLKSLTIAQIDTVWVALLTEYHQEGTLTTNNLAAITAYVRDRARAASPATLVPKTRKPYRITDEGKRRQQEGRAKYLKTMRERKYPAPTTAPDLTGESDGG